MSLIKCFRFFSMDSRSLYRALLAACFSGGLLAGLYLYSHITYTSSLMCMLPTERVSIVGLLTVLFLPLLISSLAALFSIKSIILLVAFFKGLTFCCCSAHIIAAFGDAGWLLRWLLMFSDSLMLIPLVWFWNRNIFGSCKSFWFDITVCSIIGVAVGIVDLVFISPLLVSLFIS